MLRPQEQWRMNKGCIEPRGHSAGTLPEQEASGQDGTLQGFQLSLLHLWIKMNEWIQEEASTIMVKITIFINLYCKLQVKKRENEEFSEKQH